MRPAGPPPKPPARRRGPGGGADTGQGGRRFGGANPVQPVSVETVRRQDIRVTVNAIGSIAASNTATVRPQVSGVLQSLLFKEGQQVQAGQALAQIDPRAFQAAWARPRARWRATRRSSTTRASISSVTGTCWPRMGSRSSSSTRRRRSCGSSKARSRPTQAAVDSARLQLSYTRVTAPIAGRVGLKQADLGNVVQPADANGIVTITQTRPIALTFAVPAANVPLINARLRANENVPVEAWDQGGKTRLAVGRVATLDNAIDASTDTIKVKALFANTDDALYPNQAVSVILQLDTLTDALAVPPAAVLRGAQGFYVYVVNADSSVSTKSGEARPGRRQLRWPSKDRCSPGTRW